MHNFTRLDRPFLLLLRRPSYLFMLRWVVLCYVRRGESRRGNGLELERDSGRRAGAISSRKLKRKPKKATESLSRKNLQHNNQPVIKHFFLEYYIISCCYGGALFSSRSLVLMKLFTFCCPLSTCSSNKSFC